MTSLWYEAGDGTRLHAVRISASATGMPPLILLHGGGPDHHSMLPLARALVGQHDVILPDLRGYGLSVCLDAACYTWNRYVGDLLALLDHLGIESAAFCGAGIGATITLRFALAHRDRIEAGILISLEDIEDDEAKAQEILFLDAFAHRIGTMGLTAAWESILPSMAPVIGSMVREAVARSDAESIIAAAAIGHDRAFRGIEDLDDLNVPLLIFPGMDPRHPAALARGLADRLDKAQFGRPQLKGITCSEDFGRAYAPAIRSFLIGVT